MKYLIALGLIIIFIFAIVTVIDSYTNRLVVDTITEKEDSLAQDEYNDMNSQPIINDNDKG